MAESHDEHVERIRQHAAASARYQTAFHFSDMRSLIALKLAAGVEETTAAAWLRVLVAKELRARGYYDSDEPTRDELWAEETHGGRQR